ncbi:MAG: inositol monophosphatase family protein [Nitriliruptorales bacterium]|nr:inositol monophosphatase family protein [Nitriliruptorales bacterium]
MTDATTLLELATSVAEEAGELLLDYARKLDLTVATKSSDTDPVSEADRASEQLIARRLRDARPDDGLLGEEDEDNVEGSSGIRWVVDPLDGTVNYLYGFPQWCVSVAAEDDQGVVVGVVRDPNRSETFRAARGQGAELDGSPLELTRPDSLAETLVATGFAYDRELRVAQGRIAAELLCDVRDVRRAGAAALDLAWLAAGRLDGYYEFGLSPWDWAAGQLLVEEAGGVVSRIRHEIAGGERDGLVAGSAQTHDRLTAWLEDHL